MNFQHDLKFGQQWEKRLAHDLNLSDATVEYAPQKRFYDYDVKINGTSYEVKADRRAATTGNLCIEYRCGGNPSGINKTKADAYAYYIIGDVVELYLIPVADIKQFIATNNCHAVRGGDGGRAEMYITPLRHFEKYKIILDSL